MKNINSCDICNFTTMKVSNFYKHICTKKHEMNVNDYNNDGFMCKYCMNIYSNKQNLNRHYKSCVIKYNIEQKELRKQKKNEMKNEIKLLKYKLVQANELLKLKDELIDAKDNVIEAHKTTVKASMTALKYAIKYYQTAPPLKPLSNNESINIIKKNRKYNKCDTYGFHKTLIDCYKNNILHKTIGTCIVKEYKKEHNKSEQSLWNTDCSRLSFIIMDIIKKNDNVKNKNEPITKWITDKNGVKVKEYIIKPIMNKIIEFMHEYLKYANLNVFGCSDSQEINDEFDECLKYGCSATEVLNNSDKIENMILKYIAPYLSLKPDELNND